MKAISFLCSFLFSIVLWAQDLDSFFIKNNITGAITLYDLNKDEWINSDPTQASKGTLPASTFKIIHTLIGLEEKVVKSKNDTLHWDGQAKYFKTFSMSSWNKDTDLEMAFKNSTVWYYEEISKQIKRKKYKKYLRKCKYSNKKVKQGKGYDFWNYGKLKVTPKQQINLLVKLYKNQLPFQLEHQMLTKELMLEKETNEYKLRTKTGWCYENYDIGWYVGYVEVDGNVIFFATRIQKKLTDKIKGFSKLRKTITYDILHKLFKLELE